MNNFTPASQTQSYQPYQPYQPTQYFLQPQGNIYMINSAAEVATVPVGSGVSAAICLRENAIYLKTFQNGAPMILAYKLVPLEGADAQAPAQDASNMQDKKITAVLEDYGKRLENLEKQITSKGGGVEWPKI